MFTELVVPSVFLALAAIVVPRRLERLVPETIGGLVFLTVLSCAAMLLISALGFSALYQVENPELTERLLRDGTTGFWHFLSLGAKAGLIWGPILALVVSTAPRRWTTNTW